MRDGQLTISLFRGSDTLRKVRVSIVIPLLTLSALAGLQGCSATGGEDPAALARHLTTGEEALNIVTLAGRDLSVGNNGPALDAILDAPRLITVDASGNIYIPDVTRVWRIDHATGIITTVAGTGTGGVAGDGVATELPVNLVFNVAMDGLFVCIPGRPDFECHAMCLASDRLENSWVRQRCPQ